MRAKACGRKDPMKAEIAIEHSIAGAIVDAVTARARGSPSHFPWTV